MTNNADMGLHVAIWKLCNTHDQQREWPCNMTKGEGTLEEEKINHNKSN